MAASENAFKVETTTNSLFSFLSLISSIFGRSIWQLIAAGAVQFATVQVCFCNLTYSIFCKVYALCNTALPVAKNKVEDLSNIFAKVRRKCMLGDEILVTKEKQGRPWQNHTSPHSIYFRSESSSSTTSTSDSVIGYLCIPSTLLLPGFSYRIHKNKKKWR